MDAVRLGALQQRHVAQMPGVPRPAGRAGCAASGRWSRSARVPASLQPVRALVQGGLYQMRHAGLAGGKLPALKANVAPASSA